MSKYQRKTVDTWEVQSYYAGVGWSTETTGEDRKDARRQLRHYQETCPRQIFRLKLVRERVNAQS